MAWTNKQKQLAVRACRAAGIGEEQRRDLILRNFANARHDGRITSTAPKLTNRDFESFMGVVEGYAGGRVLDYAPGFWQGRAADEWRRMRFRVERIAAALEARGLLQPGGAGRGGAGRVDQQAGDRRRLRPAGGAGLPRAAGADPRPPGVRPPARGDVVGRRSGGGRERLIDWQPRRGGPRGPRARGPERSQ